MLFSEPLPFREALDARQVKSLLPTTGNTADLARLSAPIKERAMFSATVDAAEHLQRIDDMVNGILDGKIDQATARLRIKEYLADVGYQPDPNHAGGLQDLSSDTRINLQLETNVDSARGYGWFAQGQQEDVLDEFPAQELVRFSEPKGGTSAERDWADRWDQVDGEFYGGRMIAAKDDEIWDQLGDPSNFPDGLGNPYAPFAFNSGMGLRDVDRDQAEQLGVIKPNAKVKPQTRGFNEDLQASPDVREAHLRSLMEGTGVGSFNGKGVFVFNGGDN